MDVPITFEHDGRTYKGFFSQVSGGGAWVWHLMINNYYYGQLILTQNNGWQFYGDQFAELSGFFGDYMTLWYE